MNIYTEQLRNYLIEKLTGCVIVNVEVKSLQEDFDVTLDKHLKRKGFVVGPVNMAGARHLGYSKGFISIVITPEGVLIGTQISGRILNTVTVNNPLFTIDLWIAYFDSV